jgi:hypothetical protein
MLAAVVGPAQLVWYMQHMEVGAPNVLHMPCLPVLPALLGGGGEAGGGGGDGP